MMPRALFPNRVVFPSQQELDLFAHVCHAYDFPGIVSRHKNVDVIIIRSAPPYTRGAHAPPQP